MVSGSFRAFDRRPLETSVRETRPPGDGATTSTQDTTMVARTSSPETSYSGEDHIDLPETTEDTHWRMVDNLEPPLWDWEELNWP